jgi:hypothetical protein
MGEFQLHGHGIKASGSECKHEDFQAQFVVYFIFAAQ